MRLDRDIEDEGGINLTPLIDVVFLLLIFFLAATTFSRDEVEMDLKLPQAKSGTEAKPGHLLVINISADGTITVDGRSVTIEALRQKLLAAAARNRNQEVLIRTDTRSQFGLFAKAFDACRLAKLQRIDIAAAPAEGN